MKDEIEHWLLMTVPPLVVLAVFGYVFNIVGVVRYLAYVREWW